MSSGFSKLRGRGWGAITITRTMTRGATERRRLGAGEHGCEEEHRARKIDRAAPRNGFAHVLHLRGQAAVLRDPADGERPKAPPPQPTVFMSPAAEARARGSM